VSYQSIGRLALTLLLAAAPIAFALSGGPGTQERRYHEQTEFIAEWERAAPYPIKRSGYYVLVGSVPLPLQLIWLDNERVLFPGMGPGALQTRGRGNDFEVYSGQSLRRANLFAWNTTTGVVKRYGETNSEVCLHGGQITYWVHTTDQEIVRVEGPVGQEREVAESKRNVGSHELLRTSWLNRFTCEMPETAWDGRTPKEHRILPLLPEHGYLDRGAHHFRQRAPSESRYQVKLYQPGAVQGIPLSYQSSQKVRPLEDEDIALDLHGRYTQYANFLDAYVLNGREVFLMPDGTKALRTDRWYERFPSYVFLLKPAGKLQRVNIPVEMARFDSGFGRTDSKAGYGLLLRDGSVKKVLLGNVFGIGISPDGCRIAVAVERGAPTVKPIELKMVDVCAEGHK
jgi:hypothetical protein